ncbi:Pseudouridine-metabolizing bifunctional protein [Cyphellophora attinorum]|uniref:Pseudouridine-metabolizing bifunctional protein n=1 Tax=Cyphellophora attinorum TaxID=1664694 RepID=A0A0N1H3D6_9EURO|nr:Pseudouridine-metabolizing bifunctional protein [Phialophora attinorum]KPI39370.1 Pseudouridine-metabolizing bifunctional protein [Phialophora attinorum]
MLRYGLRRACPFRLRVPRSQLRNLSSRVPPFLNIHEEVQDALSRGKPVVALETTIYTHGYPYPENVALSSRLESLVRIHGGIPATVGIVDGVAYVGMDPEQIIQLISTAGSANTIKVSRRDLSYITGLGLTGRKLNGGTTISGTMVLAHLAGIKVFATGGLGGVHRGAENSMDISADLTELGRTPVAVISAGCKSILDIGRTIEYLETQGVPTATFADGRSGNVDFPGFWTRDSGFKSPVTIQNEAEAAAMIYAQTLLPVHTGFVFANPVPAESALDKVQVDGYITQAVREAEEKGVIGNANTPFLLKRIRELSDGLTVTANTALVEANIIRGTKVAVELAKLENGAGARSRHQPQISVPLARTEQAMSPEKPSPKDKGQVDLLVVGAVASDTICDYAPYSTSLAPAPVLQTSNPARIGQSAGGVGRNVAVAAHYAGARTALASVVADDIAGQSLLRHINDVGLSNAYLETVSSAEATTAQYVAVNDARKDLVLAMADMTIFGRPELEQQSHWDGILDRSRPKWLVVDGNWSAPIMKSIFGAARARRIPITFEPVSTAKSITIFDKRYPAVSLKDCLPRHALNLITPNQFELAAMHTAARENGHFDSQEWWTAVDSFGLSSSGTREKFAHIASSALVEQGIPQQCMQLLPFVPNIVTKLGSEGVLLAQVIRENDPRLRDPDSSQYIVSRCLDSTLPEIGGIYMRLFPPSARVPDDEIVSVNGIGDTMLGTIMAGLVNGRTLEQVLPIAQEAAVLSLKSKEAVSSEVRQIAARLR